MNSAEAEVSHQVQEVSPADFQEASQEVSQGDLDVVDAAASGVGSMRDMLDGVGDSAGE